VQCQAGVPRVNGWPIIRNHGTIIIGPDVWINSGLRFNPIGGADQTCIVARPAGTIVIGAGTRISNSAIVSGDRVELGENVYLGGGCMIYDTDFHPIAASERLDPATTDVGRCAPVLIRDGAWIGGHVIVLKGVTIGRNAVIGAGSVVTRSVPDDEIWAGNPAHRVGSVTQTPSVLAGKSSRN
jgi:acetyltransferase-like isoleucine patch superfamily enzyme